MIMITTKTIYCDLPDYWRINILRDKKGNTRYPPSGNTEAEPSTQGSFSGIFVWVTGSDWFLTSLKFSVMTQQLQRASFLSLQMPCVGHCLRERLHVHSCDVNEVSWYCCVFHVADTCHSHSGHWAFLQVVFPSLKPLSTVSSHPKIINSLILTGSVFLLLYCICDYFCVLSDI